MTRKRVLFVLNAAGGGATQGIKEYLNFQRDIDAYVALPSKPNAYQCEWLNEFTKGYIVCEMPWWNLANGLPWLFKYLLYWKGSFQGQRGMRGAGILADFIVQNNIDFVYSGSILIREGALAAKLTGVKHIWHIKETFGKLGRVQFALSDQKLQKYILEHSASVICMTEYIRSFFNLNTNDSRLMVVHDGIDTSVFFDADLSKRKKLRSNYGISSDIILVGMVASLSSIWKNHKVFIEAAALLSKNEKYRFIAFGPEPKKHRNPAYNTAYYYYMKLKKLVVSRGLSDRFIWAGFCDDIPSIFQGVDLLVHPCETEPFGRVVIEAIASGVPIIVPNGGGALEPIKELGIGFTFNPNESESLASVIQSISKSGYTRQLAKNNEILAKSSYNLEAYVASMNRLFEN